MKENKILISLVAVLLIVAAVYLGILSWNALKAHDYIGVSEEQRHSIRISGEGEVVGVPDIAKLQLGYKVEKKTVAAAQKENTEKMNALISKLKDDFKIGSKDIVTTGYNIYPRYNWYEGRQTLRAYEVSQNVSVKVREMEKVSDILNIVGDLGLNQIGNLAFEIDDLESLEKEAREKAIKNAKDKAESLAKVAGVKLGRLINFSESTSMPQVNYYRESYKMMDVEEGLGGGSAPAIEAGSTEIKITATVEYEIL